MTATEKIPDAIRRAVGYELTATSFRQLGADWAASSELFSHFAKRIKEQSLSGGMSEEFWDASRQILLSEREAEKSSWLQVDFFPNSNTTATGSTGTSAVPTVDIDKTILTPSTPSLSSTPDTTSTEQELEDTETEIEEVESLEDKESIIEGEDSLQQEQEKIKRAVPILFAALQRYGEVTNKGLIIELIGERNNITWSIPDRKLSVRGEDYLEVEFDSNKKVTSYQSNLSQGYVEHLENNVGKRLDKSISQANINITQ